MFRIIVRDNYKHTVYKSGDFSSKALAFKFCEQKTSLTRSLMADCSVPDAFTIYDDRGKRVVK